MCSEIKWNPDILKHVPCKAARAPEVMALPNVTFWDGIQRLFYIVPPSESSFEKLEDVPDYISQVGLSSIRNLDTNS